MTGKNQSISDAISIPDSDKKKITKNVSDSISESQQILPLIVRNRTHRA